jgi:hypothetical protein
MLSFSVLLFATAAVDATPHVIGSQTYEGGTDRTKVAELIERPRGIADEAFVRQLIAASRLHSWNGRLISFPPAPDRMGVLAVNSATGPEMTVYFLAGDSHTEGRV